MTAKPETEPVVARTATPAVRLRGAELSYGRRGLWAGLDLDVAPGEFLAVLGPNGSGKPSLLRVLLGPQPLPAGTVAMAGEPPRRGRNRIGYIPQRRALEATVTLRGSDLVGLGLDGHHWGMGIRGRRERKRRVAAALHAVEATEYARMPL